MIEEGEEGDLFAPFRSWDKRRRELLCLTPDSGRTSSGLHLCSNLPGFETLRPGVTRRKESAVLVWSFAGFATTPGSCWLGWCLGGRGWQEGWGLCPDLPMASVHPSPAAKAAHGLFDLSSAHFKCFVFEV